MVSQYQADPKVPPLPPITGEFALIPAGSFQMGDQSNPLVGYSSELPVHSVYLSGFYMGRYEVTHQLWEDAVNCNWNADGYRLPSEAEWEKAREKAGARLRIGPAPRTQPRWG